MHRFFISEDSVRGNRAIIANEAAHARVLRLVPGDVIEISDNVGGRFSGRVTAFEGGDIIAEITGELPPVEPVCRVTIYQGLPKGQKMDTVVQKCVELGAYAVYPVMFERCVSRPDAKAAAAKAERWRKIAKEAAKQSGRGIVPNVFTPAPLGDAIDAMKRHDLLIVAYEGERERTLGGLDLRKKDIGIVIGPEGGLEFDEVMKMEAAGGVPVSLGPFIMRTETAGMAVLAAVMYANGMMGERA